MLSPRQFVQIALALTLVVVGAACGGAQKVPPGTGAYLVAIRIEGTRAIPVEDIAPGLSIDRARTAAVPRQVDPYQLSTDINRVRAAYLKLGFFDVKVATRIDQKGREQTAVFEVTEGIRSTTRVEILGLPAEIPMTAARKLVALDDGQPFNYDVYELSKVPMLQLVENAGYAQVDILATVLADRKQHVATIQYRVVPGERSQFGSIKIVGAGPFEDAVRDRITFQKGDVYAQKAMAATQTALYGLNRFTTVRVEPDTTLGTTVPVTITVTRAKSGELRVGGGFAHDPVAYQVRLRFGISYVFDALPLWSFNFDIRPGLALGDDIDSRLRGIATAKRADLFRPNLTGEIELTYDYLHYEAFLTRGPRLRLGLSSPLGVPWLTGRIGWLIERQTFDAIEITDDVAMRIGLDEPQRRGAYEGTITADLRDNPVDVRKGVYLSALATRGTKYAAGQFEYTRYGGEARGYIPLGPIVLAMRARVNVLSGEIPVTERIFAGGLASHRGFGDRNLSPYAPNVEPGGKPQPIGGTTSLENGIELRIPLSDHIPLVGAELPVGMSAFLDGGDVVENEDRIDFFHQHLAVGLAFYVKLFGFKAGIDAGQRITRRAAYSGGTWSGIWENMAFHLVVGDSY